MKGRFFSFMIATALASSASCHSAKQSTTGSASIVGKNWKLIELNGETVQPAEQLKKEPHMILNASEKRVTGTGGCNSFFGSYEIQGGNGITFSKIGSTRMACPDNVMQVERRVFQAFEMTSKFTVRNDTLFLTKADMSPLAKFVVNGSK
jgi:heat shock protein HslJ